MKLRVGFVTTEKTDTRECLEIQANGTRIGRLWLKTSGDPKDPQPRPVRGVMLHLDGEVEIDA